MYLTVSVSRPLPHLRLDHALEEVVCYPYGRDCVALDVGEVLVQRDLPENDLVSRVSRLQPARHFEAWSMASSSERFTLSITGLEKDKGSGAWGVV